MFSIFKKKDSNLSKQETYELFLDNIDNLSAIRLRGIDMSFQVLKSKFLEQGFNLTETACYGATIDIKRNQNGFYVDESRSLFSDEEFRNYQYGISFYKKNKDDFERIHQLLCEKEYIMNGYYKEKKMSKEELHGLSVSLGYGSIRRDAIYEENPLHPSDEYKNILSLLDLARKKDVNYDDLMYKVLKIIQEYFKDGIELEIKNIEDKYNMDFDDSYGVLLIDKEIGNMRMLYEVDVFDIKRIEYNTYLSKECPYMEIYLRIIAKCLKNKNKLRD